MSVPEEQDLRIIEAHYGLPPMQMTVMSIAPWGATYKVIGTAGKYVVKILHGRTVEEVEAQAECVQRLRSANFKSAPEYVLGRKGYACELRRDRVIATLCSYVAGNSYAELDDRQVTRALPLVGLLRQAAIRTPVCDLPLRNHAQVFANDVESAGMILASCKDRPDLLTWLRKADLSLLGYLEGKEFTHGDLNASNFIWGSSGDPAAVVDFASSARGGPLSEWIPLVTGLGISKTTPRWNRLNVLLRLLVKEQIPASPEEITSLIGLVALGFFGRVNATAGRGAAIEWRDADRASVITRAAPRLTRLLEGGLSQS